jgi:hypothetical protein
MVLGLMSPEMWDLTVGYSWLAELEHHARFVAVGQIEQKHIDCHAPGSTVSSAALTFDLSSAWFL